MAQVDEPDHLVSNEDIKKEEEESVDSIPSQECVVCMKESFENADIFTTHTKSSGTLIQAYLSKLTNTELPFWPNSAKYICCKTCLTLINELDEAETAYRKVKDDFEFIIQRNPLFQLPKDQSVKDEEDSLDSDPLLVKDEDLMPEEVLQCEIEVTDIKKEESSERECSNTISTSIKLEQTEEDIILEFAESTAESPGEQETVTGKKLCKGPNSAQKSDKRESKRRREATAGDRRHECHVCQRRFNLKHHLKEHMKIHTGEKQHECHVCAYRCSRKDDFLRHLMTHTGEKPFECGDCQSRFRLKSHLREHTRTHTGEKPYECNICKRRFNYKHVLKSHSRIHTKEKPFECPICQRRFGQKPHLKSHLKIHTGEKPYECTVCQNRFNRKTSLDEHVRTHTGEKPFECKVCHKRYNQKSNLLKHHKTHTTKKTFVCLTCEKGFFYDYELKRHMKVHSDDGKTQLCVKYKQKKQKNNKKNRI